MNIQLDTHTNLVDATNVEELNDYHRFATVNRVVIHVSQRDYRIPIHGSTGQGRVESYRSSLWRRDGHSQVNQVTTWQATRARSY
jgi:hypothetical protein